SSLRPPAATKPSSSTAAASASKASGNPPLQTFEITPRGTISSPALRCAAAKSLTARRDRLYDANAHPLVCFQSGAPSVRIVPGRGDWQRNNADRAADRTDSGGGDSGCSRSDNMVRGPSRRGASPDVDPRKPPQPRGHASCARQRPTSTGTGAS